MKANTKYIASDGYQYFMCPFTKFQITQGEDTGTHLGTKAVDFASGTVGYKAAYYAPADSKCVFAVPSYGQAIWITTNKVHCPNGYFGHVCFVTCHDNSFNAYVGMIVKQGSQIGNMGDMPKSICSGVHCHFQCNQASDATWIQNKYGIYMFKTGESYVDDTFYVDDTEIVNPMAGNWRKCNAGSNSGSVVSFDNMEKENWAVKFKNDTPITIHSNSSKGASIGKFVKGETQVYTRKGVGNGHRWIGWEETINGTRYKCVCAISGSEERGKELWVELVDPKTIETQKEEEKEEEREEVKVDYTKNVEMYGCDVSAHNDLDFSFVLYDYAIIRASYGTVEDSHFKTYADRLEKLGIPYGVYVYDYAYGEEGAKEEADFVLNLIKDRKIELGVWFDMEDADGWKKKNGLLTESHISKVCKVFCDKVKEAGYFVGVYTTKIWQDSYVKTSYPLWVAHWGVNDGRINGDYSDFAVMHQYSSAFGVDKNVSYRELEYFKSEHVQNMHKLEEEKKEEEEEEESNAELKTGILKAVYKILKKILKMFE